MTTVVAIKLFGLAVAGAVIAFVIGIAALTNIWNEGYSGAGRATLGCFISLCIAAVPLWSLPSLWTLPPLNDISTDTASPPAFDRIARVRQSLALPVTFPRANAGPQVATYPDVKPLQVARSVTDVYSVARDSVNALGWKVIDEQAPQGTSNGQIEAFDRTLLFGFTDDVVIRVSGTAREARIDVRSASRYGQHDLGRNAERIQRFVGEVRGRLSQLDNTDRMERLAALRKDTPQGGRGRVNAKDDDDDDDDDEEEQKPQPAPARAAPIPLVQTPDSARRDPASRFAPDLSQPSARSEPARPRRQRRPDRTQSLRRFWEQVGQ